MEIEGFKILHTPGQPAPPPAEAPDTPPVTPPTDAPATPPADPPATPPVEVVAPPAAPPATPPTDAPVTPPAAPPVEPAKPTFAHEYVEKLNEFVKNGGDPKLFLETQGIDYDAMSDEAAVKAQIRKDFPDATPAAVEAYYRKNYPLDRELHAEEDVLVTEMKLKGDANRYRQAAKTEQAKYAVAPGITAQQAHEAQLADWQAATAPVLAGLQNVELSYGEGEQAGKVAFALPSKGTLDAIAKDPANVFQRWVGADGRPDIAKMTREIAILDHYPAILAQAASEARAKGIELGKTQGSSEVIDRIENTSRPGEHASHAGTDPWAATLGNVQFVRR